ncbi:MAG: LysE/ArgO family amino acid transporter [Pseudomonadales bacterium]
MLLLALVKGFGLGGSLIVAIGAQNAFVLSSALRKQKAFAVAMTCIFIDVSLIFGGVFGLAAILRELPQLIVYATYFGALFLLVYGALAFYRAWSPQGLKTQAVESISVRGAVLTTAALSLLNPHVYLDTVILLGSIGGQLPDHQPLWFAVGASIASIVWFTLLVLGGRALAPWFKRSASWRKLDVFVGATMWVIAFVLLRSTF